MIAMKPVDIITKFVKGFVIGASMLVPGVSGGTMAIILNIYDQLISAVSRIRQDIKGNSLLLFNYAIGGLAGILLLSRPLLFIVEKWPMPSLYFFMGCIIASIPPLYSRVKTNKIKVRHIIYAIIGIAVGVSLKFIPEGLFDAGAAMSVKMFLLLVLAGFIIAIALILPGISGSYMLLVFGMYHVTLEALKGFDVMFLVPLVIGLFIGTFGTAKVLDKLMEKHPQFIYMLIIGFMLGSLYQIFPGVPTGVEIPISVVCIVTGFIVIFLLVSGGKKSITKQNEKEVYK